MVSNWTGFNTKSTVIGDSSARSVGDVGGAEMETSLLDLDETDLKSKSSDTGSPLKVTQSKSPLPQADVKHCGSCCTLNTYDANWCIACGTSVLGKNEATIMTMPVEQLMSLEVHTLPSSYHSACSKDTSKHIASYCEANASFTDSIATQTAASIPKASVPKRHWETSKCYAWRKPTSYKIVDKFKRNLYTPKILSLDLLMNSGDSSPSFLRQKSQKKKCLDGCILRCPTEILLRIFSYLKQSDLFSCMLVCKIFYTVASDHSLWKNITLLRIKNVNRNIIRQIAAMSPIHLKFIECQGDLKVHDVLEFIVNFGNKLKSLTVEMCDFGSSINDVLLLSAANYCAQLSSISVDWIPLSDTTLVKVIAACQCLTDLCIKHPSLSVSSLQALFEHHHAWLKQLHLESTTVSTILAATKGNILTHLKSFTSLFNVMDGNIMRRVLCVFPKLISLHIHCTSNSNVFMEESMKELRKTSLEALNFRIFMTNSMDTPSCFILSQISTLKHLGIDCLGDEQLEVLCQGSLRLETLDISRSLVTDNCFSSVLNSSFHLTLRYLKINNCDGINDATVKKALKSFSDSYEGTTMAEDINTFICSCPSLRAIELRGLNCALELKASFTDCRIRLVI